MRRTRRRRPSLSTSGRAPAGPLRRPPSGTPATASASSSCVPPPLSRCPRRRFPLATIYQHRSFSTGREPNPPPPPSLPSEGRPEKDLAPRATPSQALDLVCCKLQFKVLEHDLPCAATVLTVADLEHEALLSMVVLPDCNDDGGQREFVAEGDKMKGILRTL